MGEGGRAGLYIRFISRVFLILLSQFIDRSREGEMGSALFFFVVGEPKGGGGLGGAKGREVWDFFRGTGEIE